MMMVEMMMVMVEMVEMMVGMMMMVVEMMMVMVESLERAQCTQLAESDSSLWRPPPLLHSSA